MENSNVMNGGEGLYSYAKNSVYQRSSFDVVQSIIQDEISSKLDITQLSLTSPSCFRVADFGCSTGHNSSRTMELIINVVQKMFTTEGLSYQIPEFQVFFNDQVANDFNTLFTSLPRSRNYHVAGVPGPFHGRLFPKSSLHLAHSSWSLHWLSESPKALGDRTSLAWNKGRIHYDGAPKEVLDAYSDQFSKDIELFLVARAHELVGGGLMTLLIPAVPDSWDPKTSYVMSTGISILGSCLAEIANEGRINKELIDSFNVPLYMPTPEELKMIIESNCNFSIERIEILNNPGSNAGWHSPKAIASFYRSVAEGMMRKYLHPGIIDELFCRFEKKIDGSSLFVAENDKTIVALVVLRRKNE